MGVGDPCAAVASAVGLIEDQLSAGRGLGTASDGSSSVNPKALRLEPSVGS